MTTELEKFQNLLRQLFQFDCADLDFGIYRILNYKRKQVEEFIAHRLPQIVDEAFQAYAESDKKSLQEKIESARQEILQKLGKRAFDQQGQLQEEFRDTPLGREYLALQERKAQYQVTEDLKISVYNDLYTFFSRYYEDGDFIAKRRYGRHETYAIPYNGEEVVLHWATKDQYYIKTGERFKNYRFTVQDYAVSFELRNAATEQNNNKGEKRYFVLASDDPMVWDAATKTLTVFFEYRPLTDAEQKAYGRTEQQKPQDKLNEETAQAILKQVQDPALKALLANAEAANGQSLLMKHLTRFTRRNTSDFFIHKDLRGFLRRELDFFIKSECLLLDELLAQDENLTHQHILRARVVRDIGHKIIDFLAQVEDFQKRLFEKKKFVIRTEYCLTIDRVPEALWDEVLQNEAQLDEWRELYGVNPQPTKEFLRQHPTLVVDTRHFSEDFKWRLLAHFDDLDKDLDGVLIKSENFQALNLLLEKYRGKVKCVYIDPPFNTGTNEFLYKNNYLDSSWITMLYDRLLLGKSFLSNSGGIYFRIDYHGDHYAHHLLDIIFGKENLRNELIVKRTKTLKGEAKRFHVATDTVFLYALDEAYFDFKGFKKKKEKPEWVRMHLPGTVKKNPERVFFGKKLLPVITPLSSARWYNWGQIPAEVGPMNRKPNSQNPPCPRCGATHVVKNGSKGGRPRWVCRNCGRSFGPTLGTAMYRLRVTPAEVARTLLVVMRRGSLSAAEEITGHKVETIRRWLRAAARHAEALTEVLVHDLHLSEVEVDAFWSFVKKSVQRLEIRTPRRAGWARVGDV
jgi:adenine-specific DNA-methyltransferase